MTNVLQAVYIATAVMLVLALVRFAMSRRASGTERAVLTEKARRYFILAGVMGLASAGGYKATSSTGEAPAATRAPAAGTPALDAAVPTGSSIIPPTPAAPTGWTLVPGRGAVGIGAEATHEQLLERLGDSLVVLETVDTEAGRVTATVLFPRDPMRRIEVLWHDAVRRERPAMLRVRGRASVWRLPSGVTLGSPGPDGAPVHELSVPVGR